MIFFRVTDNVNIKITDGTLLEYKRLQKPSILINENIYCTTYEDFNDIKNIFSSLDEHFHLKVMNENKIRTDIKFPKELGLSNENEYSRLSQYEQLISHKSFFNEGIEQEIFTPEKEVSLLNQLDFSKENISLAILGGCGKDIGEIVSASSAIRILYETVIKVFKAVRIDIFLNASSNSYYSRDKEILSQLEFISDIKPLSINLKELATYDYFIDTSSVRKESYYHQLGYVDAFLYKFGLEYAKIPDIEKYNKINLSYYTPKSELQDKLNDLKFRSKLLLFHPYSASNQRSIPHEYARKLLIDIINQSDEYIVVSALEIEGIKNDKYVDLSKYSKTFSDFAYIISNMDKVITVDTATYHISDAFFIPTVVLFTQEKMDLRIKYYNYVRGIELKIEKRSLSKFIFRNDSLSINHFECWKNLKISKVIKLLEKIR